MAAKLHEAIQDPAKFASDVDKYIAACLVKDDNGKDTLITMAGLALSLGCHKDNMANWLDRYSEPTDHDPDQHIFRAIKRAKAASEEQLAQECYKGRNAMALALAKCMHGYVEQQHVKIDGKINGSISVVTGVPSGE